MPPLPIPLPYVHAPARASRTFRMAPDAAGAGAYAEAVERGGRIPARVGGDYMTAERKEPSHW